MPNTALDWRTLPAQVTYSETHLDRDARRETTENDLPDDARLNGGSPQAAAGLEVETGVEEDQKPSVDDADDEADAEDAADADDEDDGGDGGEDLGDAEEDVDEDDEAADDREPEGEDVGRHSEAAMSLDEDADTSLVGSLTLHMLSEHGVAGTLHLNPEELEMVHHDLHHQLALDHDLQDHRFRPGRALRAALFTGNEPKARER